MLWRDLLTDLHLECVALSHSQVLAKKPMAERTETALRSSHPGLHSCSKALSSLFLSAGTFHLLCYALQGNSVRASQLPLIFKARKIQPCWPGIFRGPYHHLIVCIEHRITGTAVKIYHKVPTVFKRPVLVFLLPFNTPGKTAVQLRYEK